MAEQRCCFFQTVGYHELWIWDELWVLGRNRWPNRRHRPHAAAVAAAPDPVAADEEANPPLELDPVAAEEAGAAAVAAAPAEDPRPMVAAADAAVPGDPAGAEEAAGAPAELSLSQEEAPLVTLYTIWDPGLDRTSPQDEPPSAAVAADGPQMSGSSGDFTYMPILFQSWQNFSAHYRQHNAALKWFRLRLERPGFPPAEQPITQLQQPECYIPSIDHPKGMHYSLDPDNPVRWSWLEWWRK